ncbi:major facilitator superfamily transporter [Colletotrichum musicola]|uniref:Major facilitator superfamily transporter n=1 Tax=Colletotrichum musicola TaxID=2175873 RepID=A0A8H6KV42_9PEZI|nr:major facilitator superfamily transporter [Colletotrichum musicola]
MAVEEPQEVRAATPQEVESNEPEQQESSKLMRLYSHPWTQILLISFICFCLPGMFNALSGLGGGGQVDSTVAANANVALLSTTAVAALFIVGPIFSFVGPKICFLMGGWSYALYSGSLLNFNHNANGAFVIAAGAILGIGSSFIWIVQGAIMTTYVHESQKGRAIAVFWIIFNLGGGVGSLAAFGLNFNSTTGTVNDATYIALMVIMLFGWSLGLLICSPKRIRLAQLHAATETEKQSLKGMFEMSVATLWNWRVLCMLPLFFCANVFYSYQQNNVNGMTFNIRTRSLNGALYWMAQMVGGLVIGVLLDLPMLERPGRARLGWIVLFVTGMAIWGGGYQFQKWQDARHAQGLIQDIDYTQGSISTGPIFLYIFYGAYDSLWQSYCYWLMGTQSNSPGRAAVLVGAYKAFQAAGGAMAWRINAQHASAMTQLAMNWGLSIGSLLLALPTVLAVTKSTSVLEEASAEVSSEKAEEKMVEDS